MKTLKINILLMSAMVTALSLGACNPGNNNNNPALPDCGSPTTLAWSIYTNSCVPISASTQGYSHYCGNMAISNTAAASTLSKALLPNTLIPVGKVTNNQGYVDIKVYPIGVNQYANMVTVGIGGQCPSLGGYNPAAYSNSYFAASWNQPVAVALPGQAVYYPINNSVGSQLSVQPVPSSRFDVVAQSYNFNQLATTPVPTPYSSYYGGGYYGGGYYPGYGYGQQQLVAPATPVNLNGQPFGAADIYLLAD